MNDTMSILFVIKLNKQNQKGLCPLNVRLTYQKERKEFSSGLFVTPSSWNAKKQLVMPRVSNADFLNNSLTQICQKLNNCFLSLQLNSLDFKVYDIFDKYAGKIVKKEDNVVNYFRRFLIKKSQLVGKDIKGSSPKSGFLPF